MSGLKVRVILLKRLILPLGGVALGRVCACSLRSIFVYKINSQNYIKVFGPIQYLFSPDVQATKNSFSAKYLFMTPSWKLTGRYCFTLFQGQLPKWIRKHFFFRNVGEGRVFKAANAGTNAVFDCWKLHKNYTFFLIFTVFLKKENDICAHFAFLLILYFCPSSFKKSGRKQTKESMRPCKKQFLSNSEYLFRNLG